VGERKTGGGNSFWEGPEVGAWRLDADQQHKHGCLLEASSKFRISGSFLMPKWFFYAHWNTQRQWVGELKVPWRRALAPSTWQIQLDKYSLHQVVQMQVSILWEVPNSKTAKIVEKKLVPFHKETGIRVSYWVECKLAPHLERASWQKAEEQTVLGFSPAGILA
jgi:hypothetical protein